MAGKQKEPHELANAIGVDGGASAAPLLDGPIGRVIVGIVGHWLAGKASEGGA